MRITIETVGTNDNKWRMGAVPDPDYNWTIIWFWTPDPPTDTGSVT